MSAVCGVVLDEGTPWEHRCGLPPHPVGKGGSVHVCADCGDEWSSELDDELDD